MSLGAIITRIKTGNRGGGVSSRREGKSVSGELKRKMTLVSPFAAQYMGVRGGCGVMGC